MLIERKIVINDNVEIFDLMLIRYLKILDSNDL